MKTTFLATLAFLSAGAANAATTHIDLSGFAPGTDVSGVTIDGATVGTADVEVNPAGDNALLSFLIGPAIPIRLDFVSDRVTSFMANGSDFGGDEDNYVVEAYAIGDVLIDTDTAFGPSGSFDEFMMSVTGSFIDYVVLFDTGDFPGAVYWSDLKYTTSPIPLPAAGFLLLGGLAGLGLAARRRRTA